MSTPQTHIPEAIVAHWHSIRGNQQSATGLSLLYEIELSPDSDPHSVILTIGGRNLGLHGCQPLCVGLRSPLSAAKIDQGQIIPESSPDSVSLFLPRGVVRMTRASLEKPVTLYGKAEDAKPPLRSEMWGASLGL